MSFDELKPIFVEPQYAELTLASSLISGIGYYLSKSSMIILWPDSDQWFIRSLMSRIWRILILDSKKKDKTEYKNTLPLLFIALNVIELCKPSLAHEVKKLKSKNLTKCMRKI